MFKISDIVFHIHIKHFGVVIPKRSLVLDGYVNIKPIRLFDNNNLIFWDHYSLWEENDIVLVHPNNEENRLLIELKYS